jgi:hypothetical protein
LTVRRGSRMSRFLKVRSSCCGQAWSSSQWVQFLALVKSRAESRFWRERAGWWSTMKVGKAVG